MGAVLCAFVYAGCFLTDSGLLEESSGIPVGGSGGTPSGTTTFMTGGGGTGGDAGSGGIPMGGGGSGGVLNGGGGSGGGVPTQIADCRLWLRADLGTTETASGVSVWENQCAPGQDAIQNNALYRPMKSQTGGPGAMAALDFVRAEADHFQLTLTDTSNSYTLYAVLVQRSEMQDIQALLTTDDTTGTNKFFTLVDPPGGGVAVGVQDGTSYRSCFAPVAGGQWLKWLLDASTTTLTCARNGGTAGTSPWGGTWNWTGIPIVGAYKLGNHAIDALVSELILYNRVLTPAEMTMLEDYLSARYSL